MSGLLQRSIENIRKRRAQRKRLDLPPSFWSELMAFGVALASAAQDRHITQEDLKDLEESFQDLRATLRAAKETEDPDLG